MSVDKIVAPDTAPTTLSDWGKINNIFQVIALMINGSVKLQSGVVKKGSAVCHGGAWYVCNTDTTPSGTASEYIKLVKSIDGLTLSASFISDLAGVSFSTTFNHWVNTSGDYIIFDELLAFGDSLISIPSTMINWRPRSPVISRFLSASVSEAANTSWDIKVKNVQHTDAVGVLGDGTTYGVIGTGYDTGVVGYGTIIGTYGTGLTGVKGYGTVNYGVHGAGPTGVRGEGDSIGVHGSGPYGVKGVGTDTGVVGEGTIIGTYGTGPTGVKGYGTVNYGVHGAGPTGVRGEGDGVGVNGTGTFGLQGTGESIGVHGVGPTAVRAQGTTVGVNATGETAIIADGGAVGIDSQGEIGVYGHGGEGLCGVGSVNGVRGEGGIGVIGDGTGSGMSGLGVKGLGGYRGVHGEGVQGVYGTGTTGVYGDGTSWGVVGVSSGELVVAGVLGTGVIGVRGNGTTWDFYAGGSGGNYGPFTGSHEISILGVTPEIGMIISCTGNVAKFDGSISATIPECDVSTKENDSAVFGVFTGNVNIPEDHWAYDTTKEFGVCNSLGDGQVLVTNINGEIKCGDYITTSKVPGYGSKQADDVVHSYTLGKCTETIDWDKIEEVDGYKRALIACVYVSA